MQARPDIYNGADWLHYLATDPLTDDIVENYLTLCRYADAAVSDPARLLAYIDRIIADYISRRSLYIPT